jgi:hypothetical protein
MPPNASVFVFAHTGHALIDLVVFMGPVAVLSGWLVIERRRAKRREDGGRGAGGPRRRDAP